MPSADRRATQVDIALTLHSPEALMIFRWHATGPHEPHRHAARRHADFGDCFARLAAWGRAGDSLLALGLSAMLPAAFADFATRFERFIFNDSYD